MRVVSPSVYVIAEPKIDDDELKRYFHDSINDDWDTDSGSDSEKLVEVAGRLCYQSFADSNGRFVNNKNVTKARSGNKDYIANILKVNHGSVLEHSQVTFLFKDISRVLTHELVRHRVGVAISQESNRYVRLSDVGMFIPESIDSKISSIFNDAISYVEAAHKKMCEITDIDNIPDFARKKMLTSALRRILPTGSSTSMLWSCNLRELRHIIQLRTSIHSEEEMRILFNIVANICKDRWSSVFQDLSPNDVGEWIVDQKFANK